MRRFELDRIIDLPQGVVTRSLSGQDIHVAPDNPSWMVTTPLESTLLGRLLAGDTPREAAELAVRQHGVVLVEESMVSLLGKVEGAGFYDGATVVDENRLALHFYITNDCNLHCKHCYKGAGEALENELSTTEVKRLIADFSRAGPSRVILSGGEVLRRTDFFEIAEDIKAQGHKLFMVTNGTLITQRSTAERLAALADFLQISIDGATATVNDHFRGIGTYDKIVRAINLFTGLDYQVNIGIVVSEQNFEDLRDNLGDLLERITHDNIKLNVSALMPYGRGQSCKRGNGDLVERLIASAGTLGIQPKQWRVPNTKAFDCGYAYSLTVESNGDVYYCPVATPELFSGLNVRTTPFPELVQHFREVNRAVAVDNMPSCTPCELKYLCGGGCRLENLLKRGNLLQPECSSERKDMIYRELLKLREASLPLQ